MALFHHNSETAAKPAAAPPKRRMSLFSFGQNAPASKPAAQSVAPISTSPSTASAKTAPKSPTGTLPSRTASRSCNATQLNSPVCSPVLETESLCDKPDSNIFERSVQDMAGQVKHEDYIPPALDATAEILNDKDTNLEEVEMVYSSRRNSSVIGLNMALGRSAIPLRKNSVYSISQMSHQNANPHASQSSLTGQLLSPVSPPKLNSSRSSVSFFSYADMISNDEFSRRPSVMHSYSHGGVPTVGRKMSVASNHSTTSNGNSSGGVAHPGLTFNKLSRKVTLNSIASGNSLSQLSKQIKHFPKKAGSKHDKETANLNKFLISPESSDSEEQEPYYPASSSPGASARKSISSGQSISNLEGDAIVSTTVADCIRECSTEISGH